VVCVTECAWEKDKAREERFAVCPDPRHTAKTLFAVCPDPGHTANKFDFKTSINSNSKFIFQIFVPSTLKIHCQRP